VATFCLIHGNWHDGSCWAPLAERLRSRGHAVLTPDMPFEDVTASYHERARPALDAVADAAEPSVVVGHSVGSAEAALVAAARRVALLVYLCPRFGSFAAPSGAPAVFREGFPFPAKDAEGRMV
jgi:pimeloyl-ACP methyl ester carboxylesterase